MPRTKRKDKSRAVLRTGESQRADGTYQFRWTDSNHKRFCVYAKTLDELRYKEEQIKKDKSDGIKAEARYTTVNEVYELWKELKRGLKNNTFENYKYMYDRFVKYGFGKKKIAVIKFSDVLQFYQYLLKDKKMQVNTLETIHTVLHPTFQLAVRDNIIRTNPSDGVMAQVKKLPGRNHGVRHALTLEQQRAFIRYIENNERFESWVTLFKFLLGTGCRIGEAIGIRWDDIDFEKRIISINHSLVYYSREYKGHGICSFAVSLPKTEAGIRMIPILDTVYEALKREYAFQEENGFNETEIDGMSGFVFSNRFGNVHNPQAINRAIKRIRGAKSCQRKERADSYTAFFMSSFETYFLFEVL